MDGENDREVNLSLRLTGREVYRAVKNFIKHELKFDAHECREAATTEARETARKAVTEYLQTRYSKPSDIEWIARQLINTLIADDMKATIRDEIRTQAAKVVKEKRAEIEAAVRSEMESTGADFLAGLVRDALAKARTRQPITRPTD